MKTVHCKKCWDESETDHPHTEGWEHNGAWLCKRCATLPTDGEG